MFSIGLRNRALLLLGWDGAFRRGELVEIDLEHVGALHVEPLAADALQDETSEGAPLTRRDIPEHLALARGAEGGDDLRRRDTTVSS